MARTVLVSSSSAHWHYLSLLLAWLARRPTEQAVLGACVVVAVAQGDTHGLAA